MRTEELFAGLRDCGRGRDALTGVELLEGMRVRAQAFLRGVARLARNLHDRDALVDQERHERVTQVVGATGLQPGAEGGGPVDPLAPVAVVVFSPRRGIRSREDELRAI
jgi:hypothetical protein